MSAIYTEMEPKRYVIHPLKFALWLFILTVIMIFGGFTSAYIVDRGSVANPLAFDLPDILWNNLFLIPFSSVPIQYAAWTLKRGETQKALYGLGMAFLLGLWFLWGQWQGFSQMADSGLYLVNPTSSSQIGNSVSFFYVITGVHGVHLIAALIAALVVGIQTLRLKNRAIEQAISYELLAIFWHFLGALWLYLFIFLKYNSGT